MSNIFSKLNLSSRAAANAYTFKHQLVRGKPTSEIPTTAVASVHTSVDAERASTSYHVAMESERIETLVIGGGQAGLSVGYHLAKRGRPFLILDANQRIGDSWRQRWDSLRLFTPARWDGLDGMPFPAPSQSFPTKDAMADYLESYAAHFRLPVRNGMRVERLSRDGAKYIAATRTRTFIADHVVVAMSSYQTPRVPHSAPS